MRRAVLYALLTVLAIVPAIAQTKSNVRLGMYSAVAKFWDVEGNWQRFERAVAENAGQNIDVVITPECYLDGYAVSADDWTSQRFASIAQDVQTSEYIRRLRALAARYKIYILFGFTEISQGHFYDSAILVDRSGATVGVYRKTMLQVQDLRFSPGEDLPVFETEWGKVGILICADRRWPESARVERLKGARIVLIPADGMWDERNEAAMRTRSYENGNFLAFVHPRTSFVSDPNGELIGLLRTNVPAMLVTDVDLSKIYSKDIQDRRPELYDYIAKPK